MQTNLRLPALVQEGNITEVHNVTGTGARVSARSPFTQGLLACHQLRRGSQHSKAIVTQVNGTGIHLW